MLLVLTMLVAGLLATTGEFQIGSLFWYVFDFSLVCENKKKTYKLNMSSKTGNSTIERKKQRKKLQTTIKEQEIMMGDKTQN